MQPRSFLVIVLERVELDPTPRSGRTPRYAATPNPYRYASSLNQT